MCWSGKALRCAPSFQLDKLSQLLLHSPRYLLPISSFKLMSIMTSNQYSFSLSPRTKFVRNKTDLGRASNTPSSFAGTLEYGISESPSLLSANPSKRAEPGHDLPADPPSLYSKDNFNYDSLDLGSVTRYQSQIDVDNETYEMNEYTFLEFHCTLRPF